MNRLISPSCASVDQSPQPPKTPSAAGRAGPDETRSLSPWGSRVARQACLSAIAWLLAIGWAQAQEPQLFAGALLGVSTLSADGRAVVIPSAANVSLYKPENGPAVNVFAGVHLTRYVTLQANYIWNANDVTLVSAATASHGAAFYEQHRNSAQHAFVADSLVYFRDLDSRLRPYLSVGLGAVHLETDAPQPSVSSGLGPPGAISATRAVLRVAVGLDVAFRRRWSIRYSFSESVSSNPISEQLTPPAPRNLANFQNLFGIVRRF